MSSAADQPTAYRAIVMGVSGSGKSTLGEALAQRLGLPFADADDFHPPANVAKMSEGIPLTDADREPWLAVVGQWLADHPQGRIRAENRGESSAHRFVVVDQEHREHPRSKARQTIRRIGPLVPTGPSCWPVFLHWPG